MRVAYLSHLSLAERSPSSYFVTLHPAFRLLDPLIHSTQVLRDTSPFLTTVLAFTVSGFSPSHSHLSGVLRPHAMRLSDRVFSQGLKSLEIVQAYCMLV